MHSAMDLQNMKWNVMKKGRTGMTRRPRKLGSSTFETNKFGVEKVVDAPLKKQRLLQTPCFIGEVGVSPGPQTPSVNHEDVGRCCRSSSILSQSKKNKVFNLDDFSGIELLAAAACSSFVNDSADRVDDDLSVSKEQFISGMDSCNIAIKEATVLPLQEESNAVPSKGLRLHWDLNTVMDEWEEPCDLLVEPHFPENCSKSVNSTLEGYAGGVEAAISAVPLVMGTKTIISMTTDGESSVGKSDVIDSLPNQEKREDLSTSTTSVLREQNNEIGESDRWPITEEVTQDGCRSPRLCKSSCDNRVTSEDPLSECCGSNVTQDEQGLTTEEDSEEKLAAGYDSPFEDGELREPIENPFSEKDDAGTAEKVLSEKFDQAQITEDESFLLVKEVVSSNDINQGPREDTFKSPDLSERKDEKDESTSLDVQRIRSSNFGDLNSRSGRESGAEKSSARDIVMNQFHSRNYNPKGGAYSSQDRRHSSSERNNGFGSYRGPQVRYHSRDRYIGEYHDFKPSYFERKPHFPPKLNRPRSRSRSRSGSPIAWNFQKRKNSDTCNSGEIEPITKGHVHPESSSKFTHDKKRDTRRSPGRMIKGNQRSEPPIRYPERLKSDDHFRYTQHSARFSQMTGPGRDHRYRDNNDTIRKHDSRYDRVNRHDDGFRRFENRNSRNVDGFSTDSPKEQTSRKLGEKVIV